MDSDSEPKLFSLISQLLSPNKTVSEEVSLIIQTISFVISIDLESQPKPELELMSLVTQAISVFKSMDLDSQPEPLSELISLISQKLSLVNSIDSDSEPKSDSEFMSLCHETFKLEPRPELISIIHQIKPLFISIESKLISLISQIRSHMESMMEDSNSESILASNGISIVSLVCKIIPLVSSLDLDSLPKPESRVISLVTQTISVFNSISNSEPEWEFVSLVTQWIPLARSIDPEHIPSLQALFLITPLGIRLFTVDPDSELGLLFTQLLNLTDSTDSEPEWEPGQLISLSPQLKVELFQGKFHVKGKVERKSKEKVKCNPGNRKKVYLARAEDATHFRCKDCNGEDHGDSEKTLVEFKHRLHPKHFLQLVSQKSSNIQTRKCYCCDEDLEKFFYYCPDCDYAMNIACANKPPALSIDHPKWHEHALALFPRHAFLTCNVCALADSSSPIYMCPPCDFVVHLRCLNLPRVIRISRHPHRISFIPSFDLGDCWSCGVCRQKIDNDYGGYSCIKKGCSYAAHSRCATQGNVWDGIELEGVPEDIEEEEVEPFVRISDEIIQHFSHQQHHLRLDDCTGREYDENKQCQACTTPIYFGNFYSCMQCDFILHETCANFSRKIHHPIHAHLLTLVAGSDSVTNDDNRCSACPWWRIAGFFYKCSKEGCSFKLHVQCATISEPLVHESHMHPLFLTSKPGEQRACSVCKDSRLEFTNETFNCIECDFALCFKCATLPQKVRYKHDKHILTLSYGEETSTMTYWCETCENKVNPKERFYICDDYCCVTLHIECLIGKELYMNPGSCFFKNGEKLLVRPNNRISRPFCFNCRKRCPYKIVLQSFLLIFCSLNCI